jgi:hypothetical protein
MCKWGGGGEITGVSRDLGGEPEKGDHLKDPGVHGRIVNAVMNLRVP